MAHMRRQPAARAKIDWDNPITRGLEFAYLPGFLRDITGKYPAPTLQGSYVAERRGGSILNYAGGNAGLQASNSGPLLGRLANSTIVAIGVQTGGGDAALYCERAGSGNDIYKLEASRQGGTQFTYRNDDNALLQQNTGDAGRLSGAPRFFAATKNGQAHTSYCGTLAGDRQPGLITSAGTFPSISNAFTNSGIVRSIGYDVADNSAFMTGRLDLVAGWSRALSADEIQSLRNNPWQIFVADDDNAPLVFAKSGSGSSSPGVGSGAVLQAGAVSPSQASIALSASVVLYANASSTSTSSTALGIAIRLSAVANSSSSAISGLSNAIALAASTQSPSSAAAGLTAGGSIAAFAASASLAQATLTAAISMAASATVQTSAGITLKTAIAVAAGGHTTSVASAALATIGSLSSAAVSPAGASAALSAVITFEALARIQSSASAVLVSAAGTLAATALTPSASRADLVTAVSLVVASASAASARADMAAGPVVVLQPNTKRTYVAARRVRAYVAQRRVREV